MSKSRRCLTSDACFLSVLEELCAYRESNRRIVLSDFSGARYTNASAGNFTNVFQGEIGRAPAGIGYCLSCFWQCR
jgi:hypothetical protein